MNATIGRKEMDAEDSDDEKSDRGNGASESHSNSHLIENTAFTGHKKFEKFNFPVRKITEKDC